MTAYFQLAARVTAAPCTEEYPVAWRLVCMALWLLHCRLGVLTSGSTRIEGRWVSEPLGRACFRRQRGRELRMAVQYSSSWHSQAETWQLAASATAEQAMSLYCFAESRLLAWSKAGLTGG